MSRLFRKIAASWTLDEIEKTLNDCAREAIQRPGESARDFNNRVSGLQQRAVNSIQEYIGGASINQCLSLFNEIEEHGRYRFMRIHITADQRPMNNYINMLLLLQGRALQRFTIKHISGDGRSYVDGKLAGETVTPAETLTRIQPLMHAQLNPAEGPGGIADLFHGRAPVSSEYAAQYNRIADQVRRGEVTRYRVPTA